MKKKLLYFSILLFFIFSCKKGEDKVYTPINKDKVQYVYDDGAIQLNVVVDKEPVRAVAMSSFMTEMLLALGLEDRMVLGIAEKEIYKGLETAFNKIPHTSTTGIHYPISKESFLLLNPDFVSGWDGSISPTTTGSPEELIARGIYPFAAKSTKSNAKLETVYEEFYLLGRIFGVEKKADSIIKSFKSKLETNIKYFKDVEVNKRKTAVMMELTQGGGILVASSLASDLLDKASAVNVFKDLTNDFESVYIEALLERNPDAIFFYRTGYSPHKNIEEDIAYIKKHPALKNMDAVKNDQIHVIYLTDLAPGIRNIDLIIKMNKLLYE